MFFSSEHLQFEVSLEHELLHRVARLLDGQPVLEHLEAHADTVLPGLLILIILFLLLLCLFLVLRSLDGLLPEPAHLALLRLLGHALVALQQGGITELEHWET